MKTNDTDHGLPTEALFYLLHQDCSRTDCTSMDDMFNKWEKGDVLMTTDQGDE